MLSKKTLYTDFTALIKEHEKLVFKVCNLYTEDTEDCKDLFQEIVLQAWISYPKFRGDSKASTWLYRVSLNTAINHTRKQKRKIAIQEGFDITHIADVMSNYQSEEYKILQHLISELPSLEKALVLLYLEDNSHQEIADIMGLSVSNVGTKLGRIKEKMKKQVTQLVN